MLMARMEESAWGWQWMLLGRRLVRCHARRLWLGLRVELDFCTKVRANGADLWHASTASVVADGRVKESALTFRGECIRREDLGRRYDTNNYQSSRRRRRCRPRCCQSRNSMTGADKKRHTPPGLPGSQAGRVPSPANILIPLSSRGRDETGMKEPKTEMRARRVAETTGIVNTVVSGDMKYCDSVV